MGAGRSSAPGLPRHVDVLVAGAGPAGCAVALGLRALVYRVLVVHTPRPWHTIEGVSARTRQGLINAGLGQAAALVPPPAPRRVEWNGERSEANGEHLVQRPLFDRALLQDLAAAEVATLPGRLRSLARYQGKPHVAIIEPDGAAPTARLTCDFFVEARGRAAPGSDGDSLRGPDTVSLLQQRRGTRGVAGNRGTHVGSFRHGWVWQASPDGDTDVVQITVDPKRASLPGRAGLADWFEGQLSALPAFANLLQATVPTSDVVARGSTSLLRGELVGAAYLRVGDAAMAVDPLSGNGVFQSLSSALAAPAVINTLLQRPKSAALAARFYRERVEEAFLRFARTGRDFYRMESRWSHNGFWLARSAWPDDEPLHTPGPPAFQGVAPRPVIASGFIEERPVAITRERPQGVWQVAGVELAPLLQALPAATDEGSEPLQSRLATLPGIDSRQQEALTAWLRHHRLL